jgi:hypothetical protein
MFIVHRNSELYSGMVYAGIMSKNRPKRAKRHEHKKDLQKKQALEQELENIISSADSALQEKISAILADEELIEIRSEGLVTKGKDGKTRVHFWQ